MSTLYPYVCECGVRFHSLPMPNIHCRSCGSMNIKTAAQAERDTTNPLHAALVQTEYYIQRHESGFLGNAPIWWCNGGKGYSAYLENAERFTKERAEQILDCPIDKKGEKFRAWPCDFIDARTFTVYDMQYFHEFEQWKAITAAEAVLKGETP